VTAVTALAGALLVLTGCTGGGSVPAASQPSADPSPPSVSAAPTGAACDEVVAGINDFNAGDYEGTVEHFKVAVRLAEAEDDGSQESVLLLMAVQYYADLAPEDYPEAAESSSDFARWKAVTLGQCAEEGAIQPPPSDEESSVLT
jgi:hypothetical protein